MKTFTHKVNFMRIANKNASDYVSQLKEFKGSNLAATYEGQAYIVRSYQRYPIFIYLHGIWYENAEGYSVSTKRQMHYCRLDLPLKLVKKSHEEMKNLLREAYP